MAGYILTAVVALVIGIAWGGVSATNLATSECERLGGFYVGGKTYKCELVEEGSQE